MDSFLLPFVQKSRTDVGNFDKDFTSEEPTLTPIDPNLINIINQEEFKDFTYVNEEYGRLYQPASVNGSPDSPDVQSITNQAPPISRNVPHPAVDQAKSPAVRQQTSTALIHSTNPPGANRASDVVVNQASSPPTPQLWLTSSPLASVPSPSSSSSCQLQSMSLTPAGGGGSGQSGSGS